MNPKIRLITNVKYKLFSLNFFSSSFVNAKYKIIKNINAVIPFPIQWCVPILAKKSFRGLYNSPNIVINVIKTIVNIVEKFNALKFIF